MTILHSDLITLPQLIESAGINTRRTTENDRVSKSSQPPLATLSLDAMIALSQQVSAIATIPFNQFRLDSRQVAVNDVFVLLKSQTPNCQKSRHHLYQAAQNAAFILSEIDPSPLLEEATVPPHAHLQINEAKRPMNESATAEPFWSALPCPMLYVPNIRDFLGDMIQTRLQYQQAVVLPNVIAVTGTNGKTTISQLVAQLTQLAGMQSAIMGTAGNGRLGALVQASHTTGDVLAVQQFIHQMGTECAEILALEASSHGLDQQRLQGVPISVAIYTNLSRDHLDYHSDMAEYAAAKSMLFDKGHFPTLTHAIINADDDYASLMMDRAKRSGLIVWTYSLEPHSQATFVATQIRPSLQGVEIELHSEYGDMTLTSPLLGRFNVANLLAAIAATLALQPVVDGSLETIGAVVPKLQGAVGRMQRVPSKTGCFIVDYAHTPDALSQVLASLSTHCEGKLWAVFGCGGDRDAGKRPLMAQAGLAGADHVILTADNPRTESPVAILKDMQVGMSAEQYQRTHIEPSRQQAIEYAVTQASPNDIVVIAGKGHETYQEINGVRHDFDDTVCLRQALEHADRL